MGKKNSVGNIRIAGIYGCVGIELGWALPKEWFLSKVLKEVGGRVRLIYGWSLSGRPKRYHKNSQVGKELTSEIIRGPVWLEQSEQGEW